MPKRFSKAFIEKATVVTGLFFIWVCLLFLAYIIWHMDQDRLDRRTILFAVAVSTFLLPLVYHLKVGRDEVASRGRENKCERCGYDLRATPARCPECGFVPNYARIDINE